MEKLKSVFIALAALVVLAIGVSFVALMIAHIFAIIHGNYNQTAALQETSFIAALTLGLAIVLLIPYIITKEQVKREIKNYWKDNYKKTMNQFISKSERNYAHTSRTMAYLLMQKKHYYWAMAWAGDSVVAYIRRFKECSTDFELNREYFEFSLNIMKISFDNRERGEFLKDNGDLDTKRRIIDIIKGKPKEQKEWDPGKINNKIYKGEILTPDDQEIGPVRELKRVILRYIKWQCLIYIEIQEHKKLSNNVIRSIKEHLDPTFKTSFEDMVNNILKSFYNDDEKNADNVDKEQFTNDIVEKVELEEQEKVRKYLEEMLKS